MGHTHPKEEKDVENFLSRVMKHLGGQIKSVSFCMIMSEGDFHSPLVFTEWVKFNTVSDTTSLVKQGHPRAICLGYFLNIH